MLSPLAVDPAAQGRGVGGALVRAATAVADERGEPLVVLEGSPAYYSRFGFVAAAQHGLTLPLPDWAPPAAAQVVLLSAYDPTDESLRGPWRTHLPSTDSTDATRVTYTMCQAHRVREPQRQADGVPWWNSRRHRPS